MTFVTLPEAKLHLRGVDGTDEDALIGVYITAAEQMAIALLDRGVYVDGTALGVARAAAPGELDAAIADMLKDDKPYLLVVDVEMKGMVYPMMPAGAAVDNILLGE